MAEAFKADIRKWLRASPQPGVMAAKNRYLLDVGQHIRGRWRAGVRKRTRGLQNSIQRSGLEPSATAKTVTVRVFSTLPDRARWDSEGTGIYGPRKQVIRPRHARLLAWPAPGGRAAKLFSVRTSPGKTARGTGRHAGMIFARFVRGARGTRALQEARDGAETKAYEASRRAQMEAEMKQALERSVR